MRLPGYDAWLEKPYRDAEQDCEEDIDDGPDPDEQRDLRRGF